MGRVSHFNSLTLQDPVKPRFDPSYACWYWLPDDPLPVHLLISFSFSSEPWIKVCISSTMMTQKSSSAITKCFGMLKVVFGGDAMSRVSVLIVTNNFLKIWRGERVSWSTYHCKNCKKVQKIDEIVRKGRVWAVGWSRTWWSLAKRQ